MVSAADKTPLCFILGPAYHGAGMLSWRLNHHPDVLSLGTANPHRHEEQICSCGQDIKSCLFWSKVSKSIEMKADDPLNTMLPHSPFLSNSHGINTFLNSAIALIANEVSPKCWKMVYESAERFYDIHNKFRTACHEQAQHKVFVDGERSNLKFMVMASMGFPVKGVIHLVRDPRGYANAWKKYYPESPIEKPTLEWAAAHTRIQRLKNFFPKIPFLTMRYEDLIANPIESTTRALTFLKASMIVGTDPLDLKSLRIPENKNHSIGLGPQDTEGGLSTPRSENWRESLHPEDEARILKVVGPLFAEFGYKSENIT